MPMLHIVGSAGLQGSFDEEGAVEDVIWSESQILSL